MKTHLLVLPALALAVAVSAYSPEAQVASSKSYSPPIPEPVLPTKVPTPSHPQPLPVPPPQPHIVLPEPPVEEGVGSYQLIEHGDEEPGFVVQNGFDGYIIPEYLVKGEGPSLVPALAGVFGLLKLPKILFSFVPLFGNTLFLLGIVGAAGAAICAFTPFCSISLLPFIRMDGGVKSVMESERVKPAVEFITNSIDKYRELMRKIDEAAAENVARKQAQKTSKKQSR